MPDEEHHLNPDSGNPLNDGFGFVFSILATLVLTDLLAGVIPYYVPPVGDRPVLLLVILVPLVFEIVRAAMDNHFYTQERDDPVHRDRLRFEVFRYGVHFTSIVALFVAARFVVATVPSPTGNTVSLGFAALVVGGTVTYRYFSELIWQSSAVVRWWLRADETGATFSADEREALRRTPEYCRMVFLSGSVVLLNYGVWALGAPRDSLWTAWCYLAVGPSDVPTCRPLVVPLTWVSWETTAVLTTAAAILAVNGLYLSAWSGYYEQLFSLNDWESPNEFLTAVQRGKVTPADAYQELLRLEQDPNVEISFDHRSIDWRDANIAELFDATTADDDEHRAAIDRIRARNRRDPRIG